MNVIARTMLCAGIGLGLGILTSCSPKPREHVTILYQAGDLPRDSQTTVREIIVAFEKEFSYIHVEPKFEAFDHSQTNGVSGPDLFLVSADDLPAFTTKETVVDLTPSITIEKKSMDPYYPEVVAACKVDNRQHMMPVTWSTDVTFFNLDLLQKAVIEKRMAVNMQELDWESVPKFAQAFVRKDGDRVTQYALALPRPLLLIQAWGANPFAWNEVTIKSDLTGKALAYFQSLVKEQLAPGPDSPEAAKSEIELFKEQKIVFFVGPSDLLAEADKITEFKWNIAPAPKGPKRMQPGMPAPGSMEPPKPVEVWPRYARLSVSGNCIWVNSPHFAEAWEFAKFYSSEPAQRILLRIRRGAPAIKIVAESSGFLRKPPEHVDVLLSSRSHSRLDNTHTLTFFPEFCQQAFGDTAMELARGKITVDQAIDEMEGLGTDLMLRSKKKK